MSIRSKGISTSPSLFSVSTRSLATMTGDWISKIVTLCVLVVEFPKISVTVYVTKVIPIGNWEGALLVTAAIPQSSLVTTDPKSTPVAKQDPRSAFITRSWSWIEIVGVVLSENEINCSAVAIFP